MMQLGCYMRTTFTIFIWGFLFNNFTCSSSTRVEPGLTIVELRNGRQELVAILRALRSMQPTLICLNVDLNCSEGVLDAELFEELEDLEGVLLPSEILPFGTGKFNEIISACSYLIPEHAITGFTNFILKQSSGNVLDRIQIVNQYGNRAAYHLAFVIAMSLD